MPNNIYTIVLAGGCFWGTQAYLSRLKGVLNTYCVYANGKESVENPSYGQVCTGTTGFAEAVYVEYNTELITKETLLHEFFKIINPTSLNRQGGDIGVQYRTGIYYTDPLDEEVIHAVLQQKQQNYNRPIVTEVKPLSNIYKAEEYHQNYLEKNPGGYCHVDLGLIPKELEA